MTAPRWYDVTLPRENMNDLDLQNFIEGLGVDRYAYGREIGESGYEHYQIRYVLKNPSVWDAQKKKWSTVGGHVTPTSEMGHNFNYVEKEGNFYRSWEGVIGKFATIQLRPWQGMAVASLKEQNDRQVTVIIDEEGNHGKSWLGKYIEATHMGDYMPMMSDHKEWVAYAMAFPRKCYVIDVPRAESIQQKKAMWTAIEQLKNGCLYDGRYSPRKMWIDPPKLLIFANEEPPFDTLSRDRWICYVFERWGAEDILMPYKRD